MMYSLPAIEPYGYQVVYLWLTFETDRQVGFFKRYLRLFPVLYLKINN